MHVHGSWPFFYALASAVPTATTLRFCVYLHIDIYAEYQYADIGIVSCGRLSNYGPFLCSSGLVQYGPNIQESRVSIFFHNSSCVPVSYLQKHQTLNSC